MLGGRMTTVSLNGFVFFGSANSIGVRLQQVREGGRGGVGAAVVWPATGACLACSFTTCQLVLFLRSLDERSGRHLTEADPSPLAPSPSHLLILGLCHRRRSG